MNKYFDAVLFPSFSRTPFENLNMAVMNNIFAKESIINNGDLHWDKNSEISRNNTLYTQIIHNNDILTEFELNNHKYFFERALRKETNIGKAFIEEDKVESDSYFKDLKYVIITPGTQEDIKRWHHHNFINLIKWLKLNKNMEIVLMGSKSEEFLCQQIAEMSGEHCHIMCGQPWSGVLSLIKGAQMCISNDSACFHVALALQTKAIAISRGSDYVRFLAYPESTNYKVILAPETKDYIGYMMDSEPYERPWVELGINMVTLENVIEAVEQLIKDI
jgi:ADP-heptose:LPS heptosyltransferase